jgi:lysophospholipase L1-like esterase
MISHSTPTPWGRNFRRAALLKAALFIVCAPVAAQTGWHFVCAHAKTKGNGIVLTASSLYSERSASGTDSKYGFDLNTVPSNFASGACSSSKPFFFSIAARDGNYRVTLDLGGANSSVTTVRAESRRLLVDQLPIKAGGSRQIVFNVNVRTPEILTAGPAVQVQLKPREIGALDWDHELTLEFNGEHPSVRSITIQPVGNIPTVYIAGDSTVVDQTTEPWAAWGQMLPAFFGTRISVANEAESGETIRSFVTEHRLAKIMSTIRPGDYLMIQFGHNDQKPGKGYVPAATDFTTYLMQYIAEARSHGATPILVTPVNRRNFDSGGKIVQTLGDYPETVREVAEHEKVPLIDLNALSKKLFEAMGEEGTLHAFVHYPANTFPSQPTELADNTHFNSYGAYELARVIVQSIRDQKLQLTRYLRLPIAQYEPTQPDLFSDWTLPPSPTYSMDTPYAR